MNIILLLHDIINRIRLKNDSPTIICSDCTGGLIYHWLRLKFRSPFINLYMENEDFVYMLENWESLKKLEISEDKNANKSFPVGMMGDSKVRIYFMHYSTFQEAKNKWNERMARMNEDNLCVMFTNWDGDMELAKRFDKLPFKHKVLFTDRDIPEIKCSFAIKRKKGKESLLATYGLIGKCNIDQFDYVALFNNMLT